MYAIFEDGSRQYRVKAGDEIWVDTRRLDDGQEKIEFDQVLMVGEGAEARVGRPTVEGARVVARIDGERKARKITVIKFRRRKNYRRKIGHRQKHLAVTIEEIVA